MLLFGHAIINVNSPFSNNFVPAFSLFASKETIKEDIVLFKKKKKIYSRLILATKIYNYTV